MDIQKQKQTMSALKEAFGIPAKEGAKENRFKVETVNFDRHNIARLTDIRDDTPEHIIYTRYPESYSVKELSAILRNRRNSMSLDAANRLENAFILSAKENDDERVREICELCREWQTRFSGSAVKGAAHADMAAVYIIEEINKL